MSSQRNDEVSGAAVAVAIACFIAFAIFLIAYALLVFFSLLLTVWAIAAWNKPITLFGETMEPRPARWFVVRGIVGAWAIPLTVGLLEHLCDFTVPQKYWAYIMLGGYALGSLGVEILIAQNETDRETELGIVPPLLNVTPPPPSALPPRREAGEPFAYASWDDEEGR